MVISQGLRTQACVFCLAKKETSLNLTEQKRFWSQLKPPTATLPGAARDMHDLHRQHLPRLKINAEVANCASPGQHQHTACGSQNAPSPGEQ